MVIEVFGATNWINTLKARYDLSKTVLNDSVDAFTVLFYPKPKQTLLVGRFCRNTQFGVVICRRKDTIPVQFERRNT